MSCPCGSGDGEADASVRGAFGALILGLSQRRVGAGDAPTPRPAAMDKHRGAQPVVVGTGADRIERRRRDGLARCRPRIDRS